jgi:hypothetical protein
VGSKKTDWKSYFTFGFAESPSQTEERLLQASISENYYRTPPLLTDLKFNKATVTLFIGGKKTKDVRKWVDHHNKDQKLSRPPSIPGFLTPGWYPYEVLAANALNILSVVGRILGSFVVPILSDPIWDIVRKDTKVLVARFKKIKPPTYSIEEMCEAKPYSPSKKKTIIKCYYQDLERVSLITDLDPT